MYLLPGQGVLPTSPRARASPMQRRWPENLQGPRSPQQNTEATQCNIREEGTAWETRIGSQEQVTLTPPKGVNPKVHNKLLLVAAARNLTGAGKPQRWRYIRWAPLLFIQTQLFSPQTYCWTQGYLQPAHLAHERNQGNCHLHLSRADQTLPIRHLVGSGSPQRQTPP